MRKGFTMVEVLASLIILGMLVLIGIPSFTGVYAQVKRSSYNGKKLELEAAALKYGNNIKDEIKNSSCQNVSIANLIQKGYITSDDPIKNILINPATEAEMSGTVTLCYCLNKYDIVAYYNENFQRNNIYYEGDIVSYNGKLYRCAIKYKDGSGIDGTKDGKRYFEEVTC